MDEDDTWVDDNTYDYFDTDPIWRLNESGVPIHILTGFPMTFFDFDPREWPPDDHSDNITCTTEELTQSTESSQETVKSKEETEEDHEDTSEKEHKKQKIEET